MISKRLEDAINAQINAEMWSAYLYLSMSAYCQDKGYAGMANWFAIQFKEEQDHAQIFYNYLISRGGRVEHVRARAARYFAHQQSHAHRCRGEGLRSAKPSAMVHRRAGRRGRERR